MLWEANRAIHFNYMQTKNWDETEIPKLKQMKALLNFEPTRYPPPNMKNIQSSESPRIHKSSMRSPVKSPVIAKKSSSEVVENAEKISQRMRRFQRSEVLAPSVFSNEIENDIFRFDSLGIQGTCQSLEKKYLRLTSAPDPTSVRPERVLRKAIEMIRKKWTDKKDYAYVCEQLKSVRQDLGVQHIRNSLTLDTYELHARIALEAVSDTNIYSFKFWNHL